MTDRHTGTPAETPADSCPPPARKWSVALLLLAIAAGSFGPTDVLAQSAFVATPVRDFQYLEAPAMHMPTAVAVDASGGVFVADGVNDRILRFDADGKMVAEIRGVGDKTLSRPMSVKIDAKGQLWIADTGNVRVLVRAPDGTLVREIAPEPREGDRKADITDVVISGDGKTVWLVDNDNHRVMRIQADADPPALFGVKGETLGRLHHPFMAAVGKNGDLFVSDVINARVHVLTAAGGFARTIGSYGLDIGQTYRPKGVAVDVQSNVWVADGTLGVVQVFSADGTVIDVLRDKDGRPFRFESPCGITFDAEGNLYVVELVPARVRKLKIAANPQAAPPAVARSRESAGGDRARNCTVCHLEWMPQFDEGRGTRLMEAPDSPANDPLVSRSAACLSCHDGSVVDSRRRVWQDHGHLTGVEPPASVKVPPNLPLVNGQIACRTCHSAHASGEPQGDMTTAVFLRVPNTAGELCISCHEAHTRGPKLGTHPTGGMPWAIPQVLIDAGARVGPNPRELTCQVCHTPHGAANDHLLVMPTDSNQLCLTCHDRIRPGMFRDGAAEHPLFPKANAEQAAAVVKLGTKLGPDGTLLCLSCHKLHHGKGGRFMLAGDLKDSEMCLSCHTEKKAVFGTSHDLRKNFPSEVNRLGMTAHGGGPCSSCHMVHRSARTPEESKLDPGGGKCITCHQENRIGASKLLGAINHPNVKCVVCHDPHETAYPSYLRQSPADLCLECHEQAEDIAGAHAFEDNPELVNVHGQKVGDVGGCLMCHSMHNAVGKPLWGASLTAPRTEQEKCSVCHQAGGLAASKPMRQFNHTLACSECHNSHGDSEENPALLIVDPPAQNLCVRCHDENEALVDGPHDITRNKTAWPDNSRQRSDRCLACHRPHADEKSGLFVNGLAAGVSGPDASCLACHPNVAWNSKSDLAALHPRESVTIELDPDDEFMPLVSADSDEARIGCRTCHNPHAGGGPPTHLVRAEEDEPTSGLCVYCHEDRAHIGMTGHSTASLTKAGLQAESCKPCHNVHGNPEVFAKSLMWGAGINPAGSTPQDQRCLACHQAGGAAKPPAIAYHPDVIFTNTDEPEARGFLPLFNQKGEIDPAGTIACMTCHEPHGRAAGGASGDSDAASLPPARQRAMRLELRTFEMPNLCSSCHGLDALRRFLYFHDPIRRAGPLRSP